MLQKRLLKSTSSILKKYIFTGFINGVFLFIDLIFIIRFAFWNGVPPIGFTPEPSPLWVRMSGLICMLFPFVLIGLSVWKIIRLGRQKGMPRGRVGILRRTVVVAIIITVFSAAFFLVTYFISQLIIRATYFW